MLKTTQPYWLTCAFVLVSAAGCGEEPAPVTAAGGDGGVRGPDSGLICDDGANRACTCPDNGKAGTQPCYNDTWLLCNCASTLPSGAVSTAGDCLPGRYEGNFTGLYYSGFTPGGFPVPVIGLDVSGLPALTLTLREGVASGGGVSEFTTYTVTDGIVKGTADGIFPFEGTITGELNCSSKLFAGTFKGRYSLGLDFGTITDLNSGYFEGPVTAVYDGVNHTFKPGTWDVLELMGQGGAGAGNGWGVAIAKLGGNGDWYADYKGLATTDAGVPDAGP